MSSEEGLSVAQISAFRHKLEQLCAALKTQEEESKDWQATVELDQSSVGRLSRIDAMQQQAMSQAEGRRRTADLVRIDAAFGRMDSEEYGWCAECGEAIAVARLEVDPMAALCIKCAR